MDRDAFEQYFRTHFEALANFALGYLNNRDTSVDIVQEVFVNLWKKRDSISPDKNVKSYLFISVKHRCLNYIRDHKKFRSHFLDTEVELEVPVETPDEMERDEVARQIGEALDKLPEKCRQIFELSRFEELKYREIAERLGVSVKTVEAQMSKALKILTRELRGLTGIFLLMGWWLLKWLT
jgi:RNA polymerase sigma-70 factor (ECF subfamily)